MSEEAQRASYRSSAGFMALSFPLLAVLGIASSIVTGRLFGIEVVGEFAIVLAPVAAMWVLSTLREQAAFVRLVASLPAREPRVTGLFVATLSFSMVFTAAVSLVAAVVVYFVFRGPLEVPHLVAPAVVSLVLYVFVQNVGWNFEGLLTSFMAGRQLFFVRLHESTLLLALYVATGILEPTVWGLVLATYGASASALVHRLVIARRFMRFRVGRGVLRDGFRALPEMLRFSVRFAPGLIFNGLSSQASTWILGWLGSVAAVGAFSRGQMLARRIFELNSRIITMLFPALVARRAVGDGSGFDRALVDTMRYSLVAGMLAASVGAGASESVMAVFGPGFDRGAGALELLLVWVVLGSAAAILAYGLTAVDRPGYTSIIAFARLVVTISLGIGATLAVGIEGPAIGMVAGTLLDLVWKMAAVRHYLTRSWLALWPRREMLALAVAAGGGYVVSREAMRLMPSLGELPAVLLLGAIAYLALFLLLGGVNPRDRARADELRTRLSRRARRRPSASAAGPRA